MKFQRKKPEDETIDAVQFENKDSPPEGVILVESYGWYFFDKPDCDAEPIQVGDWIVTSGDLDWRWVEKDKDLHKRYLLVE